MKSRVRPENYETWAAHGVARQLIDALECDDEVLNVLSEFYAEMSAHKHESYTHLDVVGVGVLHEVFVWWMDDDSILVVGWESEEEVAVGVLPPDAQFTALPFYEGKVTTVH